VNLALPSIGGPMLNPDEIRTAFNAQHRGHGGPEWVRLNLSAGPVLARRNIAHHSSPVYVVIVNANMARHYMVTIKRQLKSNGSTSIAPEVRKAWVEQIGYTAQEYEAAKRSTQSTAYTRELIAKYEGAAK